MAYCIEKKTIFAVTEDPFDERVNVRKTIAQCDSIENAKTIKDFYEKADREARVEESDNQLHGRDSRPCY